MIIRKPLALLMSLILVFSILPAESSHAANNAVAKTPVNANPLVDHKLGADLTCSFITIGSTFI